MTHDPLLDSDDPDLFAFIRENAEADVKALGLKPMPDKDWPRAAILDQITARQKAKAKMPGWLHDDIVLPGSEVIEQASSTATALYKASVAQAKDGAVFADLTAGTGVDAVAFAPHFRRGICVEADGLTARRLQHNLACFFGESAPVVRHSTAEAALADLPACDLIYIDPQRRGGQQTRAKGFAASQPDVTALVPQLLDKAGRVLIKASPMLDIDAACEQLGHVVAVHIVEYAGSVRELLFDCRRDSREKSIHVHAVAIDDQGGVAHGLETAWPETSPHPPCADPARYLYEPSPAIMKSQCFATLAAQHDLARLAPATHLFTADQYDASFPGHIYAVKNMFPFDRKALQRAGISRANVKCRNFPESPEALRGRLRLRDGGDDYLFACQLADERYRLIYGRKMHTQK